MSLSSEKRNKIKITILSLSTFLTLAFIISRSIFFVEIVGQSMKPTLLDGQRLVGRSWFFSLDSGDIVVIQTPGDQEQAVKRLIGLPGDQIRLRGIQVERNGKRLEESYLGLFSEGYEYLDIVVPADHIFVMGDNRSTSVDSREFGCVPVQNVLGIGWFNF